MRRALTNTIGDSLSNDDETDRLLGIGNRVDIAACAVGSTAEDHQCRSPHVVDEDDQR